MKAAHPSIFRDGGLNMEAGVDQYIGVFLSERSSSRFSVQVQRRLGDSTF